jgi:hypothetical protein
MKLFDGLDYDELCYLFEPTFNGGAGYAGYKPEQLEAPNGDGNVDTKKRYLHVALKYDPPAFAREYLARAHFEACRIAEAIGVPDAYYPKVENGTLRVLDYPAGAGSAEHTDFDLFTVHCYRSTPEDFLRCDAVDPRAEAVDPDVHFGDIGQAVGLGTATRHYVPERDYAQRAIVYFAMPANGAIMPADACIASGLPIGTTAIKWIADRYSRSRVYR